MSLANELLTNPVRVMVTPEEEMIEKIKQSVYLTDKKKKIKLLVELLQNKDLKSVLVFSRTKHGANKIVEQLEESGVLAKAIHGNKSQTARQKALTMFKNKKIRVLVATDIAARGIDVDELSHVINFDLPEVPETYIHRIGRTGRAGLGGYAISFCSQDQYDLLLDVQKHIKMKIPVMISSMHSIEITKASPKMKSKNSSGSNKSKSQGKQKRSHSRKRTKPTQSKPKSFSRHDNKNKSKRS